jgi:hypothetical protein
MTYSHKTFIYLLQNKKLNLAAQFARATQLEFLGIDGFPLQFPPKSTNNSCQISRKSPNRLKPDFRPAKAGTPAKSGPYPAKAGPTHPAGQRRHRASPASIPSTSTSPRSALPLVLAPQLAQLLSSSSSAQHSSSAPSCCASTKSAPPLTNHAASQWPSSAQPRLAAARPRSSLAPRASPPLLAHQPRQAHRPASLPLAPPKVPRQSTATCAPRASPSRPPAVLLS